MKIVCAWCEQEGQQSDLGERAPLMDDRPTHGICGMHLDRYLSMCDRVTQPVADLAGGHQSGPRAPFVVSATW